MDMADDIAYGVHDLEDAIALGFIARDDFCAAIPEKAWKNFLDMLAARPLNGDGLGDYDELLSYLFGGAVMRKSAIGRLVHYFIRSATIEDNANFSGTLLRWTIGLSPEAKGLLDELKALIVQFVINSPRVQHLEFKGQRMVVSVFEAIASDPSRLLPVELAALHACSEAPMWVICDYIANFTDGALLKTYDRLFSPRNGTVFDRI
jgi:dGTPase